MSGLLPQLVRYIVFGFLFSIGGLISLRIVTGEINTRGLLHTKSPTGDHELSPARVQLLLFTLATAGNYLTDALNSPVSGKLPDVPEALLATLGGSHLLYLGSKALDFFANSAKRAG